MNTLRVPLNGLTANISRRSRFFRGSYAGLAAISMIIAGVSGGATSAKAHPHVWIDGQTTFVFVDGKLEAIDVVWLVDEMISLLLIEDFDTDRTGTFSPEQVEHLWEASFSGLAEFNYFVNLRIEGEAYGTPDIERFDADIRDGRVEYSFRIPLSAPVDPLQTPVLAGFYDDTFFVEVTVPEEAIGFAGTGIPSCEPRIFADTENPIYFGYVDPPTVDLGCS